MGWTQSLPLLCRIGTTLCLIMLPHAYNVRGDVIAINPDNSSIRFNSMPSNFGSRISSNGLEGYLVVAEPYDGCTTLAPPPVTNKTAGAIFFALIRRNDCDFDIKVWNAQQANYDGVIVHNVHSNNILPMSGAEYAKEVVIPSVFVGEHDGLKLGAEFNYTTGRPVTLTPYISFPPGYYLLPFITVTATCMIFFAIYMIAKYVRDRRRLRRARLSKDHLKKIPTKKFKKGDEYDICAICLDEYEDGDKLRILPCNHAFHTKCIDPWLTNNKRTCPVCKRKVVPKGEQDSSDDSSDDDEDGPNENTPLLNGGSGGGTASSSLLDEEQSQSSRSTSPTLHVDASTAMTPAEDTDEESSSAVSSADSYEMAQNAVGAAGTSQPMTPVAEMQIEHEVLIERPDESTDDSDDNNDEFVHDENARLQKV